MNLFAKFLFVFALFLSSGFLTNGDISIISEARAADCVANNNLSENAQTYIGRCRKGTINSEFPGGMYSLTLNAIKSGSTADHKKAWKLLNDNRFAK